MKLTSAIAAAIILTFSAAATAAPAGAALPNADRLLKSAPVPVPTTATVTADQLGADSTIAVVTKGYFEKDAKGVGRSLEVITADGVRHPVWSVTLRETPAGWYPGDFTLSDWRPEMHAALLRVSLGGQGDKAVSYDVTTGATHEVKLPQEVSTVSLNPDGTGVLVTTYPSAKRAGRVATLSWEGVKSLLPARAEEASITSVDGHTLVTNDGRERQWWVTDLSARTSTAIATPGNCGAIRWYDATSVVANCMTRRGSQLTRIGLDGTVTALGIRHTEKTRAEGAPIFNDDDIRVVQGKSWFESYGGCGGGLLTRQTAAGKVRIVRVPGLKGALSVIGTRGDDLLITHGQDDCTSEKARAVLGLFDPVTRTEDVVLELRKREQWREVRTATEVLAWAY